MKDAAAAAAAYRAFLLGVGLDPDDPRLVDTPRRVVDAAAELYAGVGRDPLDVVTDGMAAAGTGTGPVAVLDIPFTSTCEHHMLPFRGRASIAYLPAERIAGIGEVDALLRVLAARPQIQERLGDELAEAIVAAWAPRGVLVRLDAEHSCMWARGRRTVGASVRTVAGRGEYREGGLGRPEGLRLVGL